MNDIRITRITDTFFRLSELTDMGQGRDPLPLVDAYLLTGTTMAVLIDTLQNTPHLYEAVRSLTPLPVTVLITHGHIDHAGVSLKSFYMNGCPIYMPLTDYDFLRYQGSSVEKEWLMELKENMTWAFGEYRLRAMRCGGHTLGSTVLFEENRRLLFTGDAVGAGNFWMHIPGTLPLRAFGKNLRKLIADLGPLGDISIYTGHQIQSRGTMNGDYLMELLSLTEDIVSHKVIGQPAQTVLLGEAIEYRIAQRGVIYSYCYRPSHIDV